VIALLGLEKFWVEGYMQALLLVTRRIPHDKSMALEGFWNTIIITLLQ